MPPDPSPSDPADPHADDLLEGEDLYAAIEPQDFADRYATCPAAAIGRVAEVLEVFPDRADLQHALALLHLAADHLDEAERLFAELWERPRPHPDVAVGYARTLAALGRHRDAVRLLDRALRRWPRCEPLLCQKLASLVALRAFDAAAATYHDARRLAPDCPACDLHLAVMRLETGRSDLAARLARRLTPDRVQRLPLPVRSTTLPMFRGRLAMAEGRWADAVSQFQSVEVHGRMPLEARRLAALALLRTGRATAAVELAAYPCRYERTGTAADAPWHLLHAEVLLWAGHDAEAVRGPLALAVALDPTLPRAELLLAESHLAAGNLERARGHLGREMLLADFTDGEFVLRLALAWAKCRRPRRALDVLDRFERHAGGVLPADLLALRAALLLRKRRYPAGLNAAYAALRLRPHDPDVLHNLALAEARRGRYRAAAGWAGLLERHAPGPAGERGRRLRLQLLLRRLTDGLRDLRHRLSRRRSATA